MKVPAKGQRGGFVMGLVVGLLLGLALALGVALYITKVPIPFIDKVPQRTAEQDNAELERNRNWDPNGPLAGKALPRVAAPGASGAVTGEPPPGIAPAPAQSPAGSATLPGAAPTARPQTQSVPASPSRPAATGTAPAAAGGSASAPAADPFVYFVQAGAYTRSEEAEQQRARLALMGQMARITEREQVGRTVYRVRMGPLPTRDEAVAVQNQLQEQRIETQIVRVERP